MTGLVLLTGASGFVGRQVLSSLSESNIAVRAVLRSSSVNDMTQRYEFESVVSTPDMFQEDAQWWADACKGVDTVIHVAWYVEPGAYLQSPINMDCLRGTIALAQGAMRAGVKHFVGIGTCFECDLSGGSIATDTALKPTSVYAGAKAAAYTALEALFASGEVAFSWCRLFYLYGEGEDARRLVPYIRNQLSRGEQAKLTSGTQIRDFLDVKRAGEMIAAVAVGPGQGVVNVCSGEPVTVRALAERIASEYGREDLLCFGARPDNFTDPPCVLGISGPASG